MQKSDWDSFKRNPIVILGFDMGKVVGRVTKVFEDGCEVELVGKQPVTLQFGDLMLGYMEKPDGSQEIVEVSITAEAYQRVMNIWP